MLQIQVLLLLGRYGIMSVFDVVLQGIQFLFLPQGSVGLSLVVQECLYPVDSLVRKASLSSGGIELFEQLGTLSLHRPDLLAGGFVGLAMEGTCRHKPLLLVLVEINVFVGTLELLLRLNEIGFELSDSLFAQSQLRKRFFESLFGWVDFDYEN